MEKSEEKKLGHSFKQRSSFLFALLLAVLLLSAAKGLQVSSGVPSLLLKIEGLQNSKGVVHITIFNRAEGFPGDGSKALKVLSVPAAKEGVQLALNELSAGTYAIAIFHDENENGTLDTNFIGYPQEGYGASNNVLPTFRAPNFSEAAFRLVEARQPLMIRLRY